MNMLLRIRGDEKEAAFRRLESWKNQHEDLEALWEVEDMLEGAIADRDKDERFLRYVAERAKGKDRKLIDETNQFIQQYCDRSIAMHALISKAIAKLCALGHSIANVNGLEKATKDYETWKDDYPEFLVMSYEPVAKALRGPVKKALANYPRTSNWREVFDGKGTK